MHVPYTKRKLPTPEADKLAANIGNHTGASNPQWLSDDLAPPLYPINLVHRPPGDEANT